MHTLQVDELHNAVYSNDGEDSNVYWFTQAMVRYNPDVVKTHSSQTVPIVFLGKHTFKTPGKQLEFYCIRNGPNELKLSGLAETAQLIQLWEELWLDIVPGTEAGLRLYSIATLWLTSNVP